MKTEFRIIFTAIFDSDVERDKAYDSLKTNIMGTVSKAALFKRADMTKDEYSIPEESTLTEKVI